MSPTLRLPMRRISASTRDDRDRHVRDARYRSAANHREQRLDRRRAHAGGVLLDDGLNVAVIDTLDHLSGEIPAEVPATPSAMYVSTALFRAAGSLFALKMANSAPTPSAAFIVAS